MEQMGNEKDSDNFKKFWLHWIVNKWYSNWERTEGIQEEI